MITAGEAYQLFQASFNGDFGVRAAAEVRLRQVEGTAGFVGVVLQIVAADESEIAVRQAAAIFFKNAVLRRWAVSAPLPQDPQDPTQTASPISAGDKIFIKAQILTAFVSCPQSVRVQLQSCLYTILSSDYPTLWPQFPSLLMQMLTSADPLVVYGGLLTLLELVKVFQWKNGEARAPLEEIITSVFPHVRAIAASLLPSPVDNTHAGFMLKTILKLYYSSIIYSLSPAQQSNDSLVPWGTVLIETLNKDVLDAALPGDDDEERGKFAWWKAKKWACRAMNKLFSKYGNPSTMLSNTDEYKAFAKFFIANFAPQILNTYMSVIKLTIGGRYCSPRVKLHLSQFVNDAIKHKNTWLLIKPQLDEIVRGWIFPLCCFRDEDAEVWEDDPVEFVHKKVDVFEDYRSPNLAASDLLVTLVTDRKKSAFLPTLAFIQATLSTETDPRKIDGALNMLGSLARLTLAKGSPVKGNMEAFIVQHVFPAFSSPHHFLRLRACDVISKYENLEWETPANLNMAFQSVLGCLLDPQLPVKITAALALDQFVKHEDIREELKQFVPKIMQELLSMTNQIDMDTLTTVMELLVEVFTDELKPFAVELAMQLRDTFIRVISETLNMDEENMNDEDFNECSDKTFAAIGVLKTISTLCISVDNSKEILSKLEEVVAPIIAFIFEKSIEDLYDDAFDIADTLTYCAKEISPNMWHIFGLIYTTFKDNVSENIEEMLPALSNYICYGRESFRTNPDLQRCMVELIECVIKQPYSEETDKTISCVLIETMLLNLRGAVDVYVGRFLEFAILTLKGQIKTTSYLVHILEVVINCIYYNPLMTLTFLESAQFTTTFFQKWFTSLEHFSRVHDKKLSLVALCSILDLPESSIPQTLRGAWGEIMKALVEILEGYPEAIDERKRIKEMIEGGMEDSSEEEEDEDFDVDDEEEEDEGIDGGPASGPASDEDNVVDLNNTAYMEYLEKKKNKDADISSDWDEDEIEEDVYFETPLDLIDGSIIFTETMRRLQGTQPDTYHALTSGLSTNQQNVLIMTEKLATEAVKTLAAANAEALAAAASGNPVVASI